MLDFLKTQDSEWPAALRALWQSIPEPERAPTRIWFSFHPLLLAGLPRADAPSFRDFFQIRGSLDLAGAVDTSHAFHPRHRDWPAVKRALAAFTPRTNLETSIRQIDAPLSLAAIGLMTLRQVGVERFFATSASVAVAKPTRAPWFEKLLPFAGRRPRITFDANDTRDGWFALIPSQEITTAAELDKRPYSHRDPRCVDGLGPIPVDCKSGSCGTCWIGVTAGNEHLSPVSEYERRRMEYFGYWDSGFENPAADRPLIRLACQTQAFDSASIIIPPWNGVWGASRRARWQEAGSD